MSQLTLTIDGKNLSVEAGTTILDAARSAGIPIPTLCHLDGVHDVGACRVCLVEVEGQRNPLPACTTEVTSGMKVLTATPALQESRRMVVEMLIAGGSHPCAVCVASGNCELQSMAVATGMDHNSFVQSAIPREVDLSHAQFAVDRNRCILCQRCVRVCQEVEGASVWNLALRGDRSYVVAGMDQAWGTVSTCTSCGKCVDSCPTGCLSRKGVTQGGKKRCTIALKDIVAGRK